jgi:hypothetical protein
MRNGKHRRETLHKQAHAVGIGSWSGHQLLFRHLFMVMLVATGSASVCSGETTLQLAGWIEEAVLYPHGLRIRAKLDSGARTTSINAVEPEFFTRDGARWVRFSITNRNGERAGIEQPIVRTAVIKRFFGKSQQRPVVELDLCLGNARKSVEVNLVDRTGLDYQLLIGRNFLNDTLLIHSGVTGILPQGCPAP